MRSRSQGKFIVSQMSAGIEPKGLNPLAVEAIQEIGTDISQQKSKDIVTLLGQHVHYVDRVR